MRLITMSLFFLHLVAAVAAEEVVFRQDGLLGREGRTQLSVPVQDGQQLVFRVASLDFPPRLRINLNGVEYLSENDGKGYASRFVHVRKPGMALVTIECIQAPAVPASYQLRVQRVRDNAPLSRQAVQRGVITADDQREGKGRFVDWYPLPVSKGQHLLIGMASRAGDTALRVELPDGSNLENDDAIGSDARLEVEVGESGTAWIGATILVREESWRDDLSVPYQIYVRDFQMNYRPLTLGQASPLTAFQLIGDDLPPLPEGFAFTAPKAGVYRFRLEGRDGTLPLLHGRLDNDRAFTGSAERSARDWTQIRCYLRQNQRIDLVASSLAVPGRPQYSLNVIYESPGLILRDGDSLERSITDPRQGFFVYHGKAGEYVEFLMASDDFETRLLASDAGGQLFTWAKFYGSDFSYASQGGYWFDQPGDLLLETAGRNPGDEGGYRITVRSALSDSLVLPREAAPRTVLASGVPFFARITERHPETRGGVGDEFAIDLKTGELLALRLQSWDIEARLELVGPDGAALSDYPDQPSKDSTVELAALKPGRYLARVSVAVPEGRTLNATYTLSPEVLGSLQAIEPDLQGKEVDLALPADRPASEAPWIDVPLRLRSAQHVYLEVQAPDFQPAIKLIDKDGIVIDENHGIGRRGHARIDFTILKGGAYRLRILRGSALGPAVIPSVRCAVSAYEFR